jgi:hypothetical protein
MSGTVISYPIPAYANVPIEAQFYKPSQFFISTITLGITTLVTTTTDNNYVIGQQVRLLIPPSFGCYQLNNTFGYVISIPSSTQVEVSINSYGGAPFQSSSATTQPQILAIGDINSGQTNSNVVNSNLNIPGSFQNISPL